RPSSRTRLIPLELPGCVAPDVNVVLVEARIVAVAGELNLKLHLLFGHGLLAYRARGTNARPPQVRSGAWEGSLPFWIAVRACSRRRSSSGMGWLSVSAMRERIRPDARGRGAGCVSQRAQRKAG